MISGPQNAFNFTPLENIVAGDVQSIFNDTARACNAVLYLVLDKTLAGARFTDLSAEELPRKLGEEGILTARAPGL